MPTFLCFVGRLVLAIQDPAVPPPPPDQVSLCGSGCSGAYYVDQAGPELRDLPALLSKFFVGSFCLLKSEPVWSLLSFKIQVLRRSLGQSEDSLRICLIVASLLASDSVCLFRKAKKWLPLQSLRGQHPTNGYDDFYLLAMLE